MIGAERSVRRADCDLDKLLFAAKSAYPYYQCGRRLQGLDGSAIILIDGYDT